MYGMHFIKRRLLLSRSATGWQLAPLNIVTQDTSYLPLVPRIELMLLQACWRDFAVYVGILNALAAWRERTPLHCCGSVQRAAADTVPPRVIGAKPGELVVLLRLMGDSLLACMFCLALVFVVHRHTLSQIELRS
jgi:hypothetical protein